MKKENMKHSKGFYITFFGFIVLLLVGGLGVATTIISDNTNSYISADNTTINNSGVFYSNNKAFSRTADVVICRGTSLADDLIESFRCDVVCKSTDTDCGDNINTASSALTSGGNLYLASGIYPVSTSITLRNNIHYFGSGTATKLVGQNKSNVDYNIFGQNFTSSTITGVWISDLYIDMNSSSVDYPNDDQWGNAIRFPTVTYSKISNVEIRNTVMNAISLYNADDNLVENNIIRDTGKTGTAPGAFSYNGVFLEFGSDRNTIINNNLNTLRDNGIRIGCIDADNYNNKISLNFINGATNDGIRIGDDVSSNTCHNPIVTDNTVQASTDSCIRLFSTGGGFVDSAIIQGNNVWDCDGNGVIISSGTSNTVVAGNIIYGNTSNTVASALLIQAVDSTEVFGNRIKGGAVNFINLASSGKFVYIEGFTYTGFINTTSYNCQQGSAFDGKLIHNSSTICSCITSTFTCWT